MVSNERDLRQLNLGSQDRDPMVLDKARLILQSVVDTSEDTFTGHSDLEKVGNHDSAEIRKALTVISIDLLKTHPHKDRFTEISLIDKQTPHGRLIFGITRRVEYGHVLQPEFLRMELVIDSGIGEEYVLESAIHIDNIRLHPSDVRDVAERFSDHRLLLDYRRGKPDFVNVKDALKDARKGSMDKFKKIHRGLRWVAYNMLNWDKDFKLPEDLSKPLVPTKV